MPTRLLVGISALWVPLAFLGDGLTVLVLPIRLGGGAGDLGIVSSLGLAVGAVAQLGAGWLSDRFRCRVDRRRFTASAAAPAMAGVWLLTGSSGLASAILGFIVVQLAAAAMQAGQQTLIPEYAPGEAWGRASGVRTAFDVGGAFLAFLVLGILISTGGPQLAGAVTITVLVVAVLAMLVLVPPARERRQIAEDSGARPVFTVPPGLAPLVAARFLFLLGTYVVGRFLLLLVAERLAIPPDRAVDEAGGLLALFALATAAAAVSLGWLPDRASRRDLMVVGCVLSGAGILLLVPPMGVGGLVGGGVLMSLGTAVFVTANWAATVAVAPPLEAGRLMSVANLGTVIAAAAAGLVGPAIDLVGFGPVLLAAAAASFAAVAPLVASSAGQARSAEVLT